MEVNTDKILAVLKVILCIAILVWVGYISYLVGYLMIQQSLILGHVADLYEMITDVYYHITNLLKMGVSI